MNGVICNYVIGVCFEGCMLGYIGNKCDKGKMFSILILDLFFFIFINSMF